MHKTYFIADLHLSETRPNLTALFVDFMQHLAPDADAVYILGDLFDFWIGDDERSPLIDTVKNQIRTLVQQGVPCYFIHGNRDFLLGKRFAGDCGLRLLPEYQVIDLYGEPTLICHGDTLCTDDLHYQAFRRKVHRPWLQWLFRRLPLKVRLKIAQNIRTKSSRDKQNKSQAIMDVNPEFTRRIFERFQVKRLIHGHTHRQNIHQIPPHFERIVLGDWGETASILEVTPQDIRFRQ
ncbi:UDP-2,3-diacylglucosamine hydrolase [Actinobacillus succinogenes]|uniref:UDP-2,3-diacylglucosamine hydrolase n=1 Tax=Actinobacillus succinogenes (strain ATCC 55618 / DSM 22257 / CCUG 43843 / 130Z) TaxID=339671 RepID=LPXH_ACTSZ|nr:UDP-2,3-diacylglucosamine diphosphatase [Actinobacillus succinogenes]A6VR19.1 RecName: Full=UDP-2,3-diacylglucosamine hydrolase; AltName: Full=UDP-2,3-diacylglucosamine diphosphatase [Actinobacillus succinogenes 130Z]ABR75416.1 UDP-2,3-diacylglucosamine hydrolase [Actinobacillus succinogenes 130Z]PHI40196.1 UDP-2,3-diacylglucosamine hydrolase [Actinobacillus succinogenes]